MKTAVISDIHGNLSALDAVLEDIARRGISDIVNLGDCVAGPLDNAGTIDRLIALNLPTVRGNHDRLVAEGPREEKGVWDLWAFDALDATQLKWLEVLPKTLQYGEMFLCHATPERDDENWLDRRGAQHRMIPRDLAEVEARAGDPRAPLMLCGHTHQPRVVRLPDGTLIVNPGSVGCPAYLDSRSDPPFIHQTGLPDARYAIVEKRDGRWCADLVTVAYDPSDMVERAREKRADNWINAITRGWTA